VTGAVPFRVLHVCTGNICRSPMAELLMRRMLDRGWPEQAERFVVESAGTWGHAGSPMEPHALTVLADHGVDGEAFRARELAAEHVAGADLVLAATREHRAAAVVLYPARPPGRSRCASSPGSPPASTPLRCRPVTTPSSAPGPWCAPRPAAAGWCPPTGRRTTTSPTRTTPPRPPSRRAPTW
jgi:protein-tyrosine-phosphatase